MQTAVVGSRNDFTIAHTHGKDHVVGLTALSCYEQQDCDDLASKIDINMISLVVLQELRIYCRMSQVGVENSCIKYVNCPLYVAVFGKTN